MTGGYVDVAGTRGFYEECGEGAPLICVHIGGADARVFRYFLPAIAAKGYRAIAPDLPGHGRTFPPDWQPATTIHDLAEFVHELGRLLCPNERPAVLGASVGGLVVLDLAARHSESYRALVAFQAAAQMPTFPPSTEVERPAWLPGWSDLFERLALDAWGEEPISDEQRMELRWLHRTCPQTTGARDATAWSTFDVRGQLDHLACPLLLGHGQSDFLVPSALVEQTAEELGDSAELVRINGLGHYPMLEDPDRLATLADDFLTRMAPTG